MLKHKLKVLIVVLLMLAFLVPTYVSFVSSSTGYIRINGTSASVPNQQIPAGGNVSLYFGEVTWEDSEFYLLLSHDNNPQISSGDSIYSPRFSVYDVAMASSSSTYTSDYGSWIVGYNWINGSIPLNIPVGNYSIKAFDAVTTNVAVTDTFITVYTLVSDSTLEISPSSGPGGVPVQFTGSNYPLSSSVTISYYDPTFGSWNLWATTTSNSSGNILVNSVMPDLRKSVGAGDYSETFTPISFRTEIYNIVYCYADYNQYSRGIKKVGNQTATGLYGNGTNLASTVKVEAGDSIPISGKWFHPDDAIYVKWDGVAVVGTVTSDEWSAMGYLNTAIADSSGSFETTITIPDAEAGQHYVAIEDSETRVIIKISMSRGALQISPSSGPGGVSVQLTGSGYPTSTPVTISYLDFFGWNYLGSTTSNSSGGITYTIEIPDLRRSLGASDYSETYYVLSFRTEVNGSVYCYADYNQYLRGLKRIGNLTATGLYGNGTNLASINQSIAVRAKVGYSLALSGKWFHSSSVIYVRWDGVAVVGTVTSDEWRDAVIIGTSIASSTGSFDTAVTIPTADPGEHYLAVEDSETRVIVKIYVEPSPTPTPTPSPTPTPEPTPTPTPPPPQAASTIDVSCRSTTTYSDFKVEIKGSLSLNGTAISGAPVLLSYSITGGSSWENLTLVDTGSDGGFLAVWKPSVTGNYLIKAKWEGNSTINGASTIVNLAVTPYAEQNVLSVASNSTISEFAFNSTSKELSFIASGPSGTTGYVNVYVPKSLIGDISSLKVYLDGSELTYVTESQGESWRISFIYQHSSRKIVLALGAEAAPSVESPLGTLLMLGAVAAVIVIVAILLVNKKRKRRRTVNNG